MPEWLRILRLLLHKNLLVRKRQWKLSLFGEVIMPVGILICVWIIRDQTSVAPINIRTNTYYNISPMQKLVSKYRNSSVYYTPNNAFVKKIINSVEDCFKKEPAGVNETSHFDAHGFETEDEMFEYIEKNSVEAKYGQYAMVIFDKEVNESSKKLKYTIRSQGLLRIESYNVLNLVNLTSYWINDSWVVPYQYCIDYSFIKTKVKDEASIPNVSLQQLPYPPYTIYGLSDEIFRKMFSVLAGVALMIPLFIETAKASNEKFLGINVLMTMNGVSNSLNLFSWLFSGWTFICIFFVLPVIIILPISTSDALPFLYYGNAGLIFLLFILHVAHLLTYGVHVSAYFTKPLYVIFGLLVTNVGAMVIQLYALKEDTYYIGPYLGIIFPNILLFRGIDEMNYYENIQEGVQWDNLFVVGNSVYKVGGSVGMIYVLSLIGIVFHFLMAIYVYSINPGKYGVRKHPLFFLKFNKSKISANVESLNYRDDNGEPFESVSSEAFTPGIQIRNLKKSYDINLFKKAQVHALRGISIDFYKGQITSLLGHNGAGKTTMMSILTGMMSPSEGQVLINSKSIETDLSEIMHDIGLCTQENMLFPNLTVSEQISFFAKLKGRTRTKAEVEQNVTIFLEKFNLNEKKDVLPAALSGGQKRRVCLGMALVGDPSTLILDEPSSGLDPESRRIIWDILLKLRGRKTIIISTHDMEEADILGDRIAIIHTGRLKSYGTAMFLKKLLGQGNVEVTLSLKPQFDIERIRFELDCNSKVINNDGTKIVLSVPNSPDLPDALDNLERKKEELGITGVSVSLISLEQVFLKLTVEEEDLIKSREPFNKIDNKLEGGQLVKQSIKALVSKKTTYTLKNIGTIILMLLLTLAGLLWISLILDESNVFKPKLKYNQITLRKYFQPKTYYKSYDENLGLKYKTITEKFSGEAFEAKDTSLSEALINYGLKNLAFYQNHMIAAAEFNDSLTANLMYSTKASYSLPISMNLLTNTLLKHLAGDEYSISTGTHQLQSVLNLFYTDKTAENGYMTAVIFVFLFFPTVALFVLHPLRESSTGVKQLQRMAGVSALTYWGTMFLYDFAVLITISLLIILGFYCMDYALEFQIYGSDEILISLMLLVIFAINVLPLVYCFSFLKINPSSAVRILTYIPIGLVTVELIMDAVKQTLNQYEVVRVIRSIQKPLFLLVPYVSFFDSQSSFFTTAQENSRCVRMPNSFFETQCRPKWFFAIFNLDYCCNYQCHDGVCKHKNKFFNNFEKDVSLEESLVYLCVTPLMYITILAILENQVIQKIMARVRKYEVPEYTVDEQVKKEKLTIGHEISAITNNVLNGVSVGDKPQNNNTTTTIQNNNTEHPSVFSSAKKQMFLVYELRKRYNKLQAVKDVSFGVSQRECFGLLGVNGAGKSTTFRMMTGGEVADNGIMYIGDKDINSNRKYFLSQMGYCPQNDAIISSLNAYDHLRLFARLRGIPEDQVEYEVNAWILRLNLTRCAAQASGTYSGGNKRRLNIAIALIGIPNLVLLDEPTTGVDPGARRSLWNVIQSCQTTGQAVVLTSHSMEECEVLCNRLAIMVGGRFVCIGPSQELKHRFGAGYDIQIKLNPERAKEQVADIRRDMPEALNCELIDENLGYLMYHVKPDDITWRKMYNIMNVMKGKYDSIEDFSVLSSTLEQLFLLFARAANDNTTKK